MDKFLLERLWIACQKGLQGQEQATSISTLKVAIKCQKHLWYLYKSVTTSPHPQTHVALLWAWQHKHWIGFSWALLFLELSFHWASTLVLSCQVNITIRWTLLSQVKKISFTNEKINTATMKPTSHNLITFRDYSKHNNENYSPLQERESM